MAVFYAAVAVAFAFILLPLLHQSPYYPPVVERLVAYLYDRHDSAELLRLPPVQWSFLRSAGGHFEALLGRE